MTIQETRQLGIEFERRVQTMIPETESINKLDTETIYSFLNQYQDKYVHEIYRSLDSIPQGSKLSAHFESVLQKMLKTANIPVTSAQTSTTNINDTNNVLIVDTARSLTFKLPENFYMYIRSVSNVSSAFAFNSNTTEATSILPNQLVSQNDVWKLVETPHNSLRILRYPAAVLGEYASGKPTITIIHDRYTTIKGIRVMYYAEPKHFDLMTSTSCELPMDVFDDLVSGAVDLYVQYVAGAEARRRQQQEAALRDARNNQQRENDSEN